MTASLRLFRIEARRNPGLLLFIPFAVTVWAIVVLTTPTASGQLVLWSHVSVTVGNSAGVIGAALAGVAAWTAGRGRRARTEELIATTSLPSARRDLAAWAAISGWGVFGVVIGGAVVLGQASLKATWGSPQFSPIAIGLLITAACATWGYAAGTWFPGRFTAPLSAVVAFLFLFLPSAFGHHPVENLSFLSSSYDSEFWHVHPDLTALHVALLSSLTVLAVGGIMLRGQRSLPGLGISVAGAAASLVLMFMLAGSERQTAVERVAYEPLCSEGSVEVCIHPAYQAVQDETMDAFERLTQPLVGVPGAPTRAEQVSSAEMWGLTPEGVIQFELNEAMTFLGGGNNSLMTHTAGVLAYGYACCDDAQEVIRGWLLQQAGVSSAICEEDRGGGGVCAGVPRRYVPDIERFAALEPSVRDVWLHDNYASLIHGELTLEDLP